MKNLLILTAVFCIISCLNYQVTGHPPLKHDDSVTVAAYVAGVAAAVWTSHAYIELSHQKWDELTKAQVCSNLQQVAVEQLFVASPTLMLMTFLQKTRIATEKRQADIGTWIANGIFTYLGAILGARLTTRLVCNHILELWQTAPHKILVAVGLTTGLGAALGFNLIW